MFYGFYSKLFFFRNDPDNLAGVSTEILASIPSVIQQDFFISRILISRYFSMHYSKMYPPFSLRMTPVIRLRIPHEGFSKIFRVNFYGNSFKKILRVIYGSLQMLIYAIALVFFVHKCFQEYF